MITLKQQDLLKAGVHLGHLSKKWHPNMAPFIFMERHGIHIIDLNQTLTQLQEAANVLQGIARSGKKILFVATKKQAKEIVEAEAKRLGMLYMTERWLGGTLTNFVTIRRLIKKLLSMEKMTKSDAYKNMAKKEQLMLARDKAKLERVLKGIMDLVKPPGALVVVDITKEHIAVREATKLGIPIIALTDTNSDPTLIDYPIPSNDDSYPSISVLIKALANSIEEGLAMHEQDRELEVITQDKEAEGETEVSRPTRPRRAERIASTSSSSNSGIEYKSVPKEESTNTTKATHVADKAFKKPQESAPKKATAIFPKSPKVNTTAKPSTNLKEAERESSPKSEPSKGAEKKAQPEVEVQKEETQPL
jgi:small subunit ribosomal protein S2